MGKVSFPVPGGTLCLCYGGETSPQYWFEYEGRIPKEWAIELARQGEDSPALAVNGKPFAEFLEGLDADQR